jgi:hypothetical protein
MTQEIKLVFGGFCTNSQASSMVEDTIIGLACDEDGEPLALAQEQAVTEYINDRADYTPLYEAYAREYTTYFATGFELPSLAFEELVIPREHNYQTDEIYATISSEDILKMYECAEAEDSGALATFVREAYSSRDGFISNYPSDLSLWPESVLEYDHNQLNALLVVYLRGFPFSIDANGLPEELLIMESALGNGFLEGLIFKHTPNLERFILVQQYIQRRENRQAA